MSEPIYDVDLVVHLSSVDDRSPVDVEMISTRSGPAGEAVIELSDSIRVAVDFAQPERLSSISISAGESSASDHPLGGEERELLGDLIGEDRVDKVGGVIAGQSPSAARIPSSRVRQQISSLDPDSTEKAVRLGQLASLSSIATDMGEASIVRLVAALEGVAIVGTFANDRIRTSVETRMESVVGSLIETTDPITLPDDIQDDLQIVRDDHRGLAREIEMVLERVSATSTEILADVAEYMVSTLRPRVQEPMLLAALEDERPTSEIEPLVFAQPMLMSIGNVEKPVMLDSAGMGRLELVWEDDPGGSWVRIMNPDDLTLVALVPVRRVDDQWEAEAIVPPDRPLNTWIIEVTSTPLGSGSRTTAERIIEAVRLGQAVARMRVQIGTLPFDPRVQAAWLACADAWQELGDEFRANKAREFAGGGWVTRRLQVADQVRTALGLDNV